MEKRKKSKKNPNADMGGKGVIINARRIFFAGITLTVVIGICVGLYVYVRNAGENDDRLRINLYFLNNNTHTVEPESRNIADPGSNEGIFEAVAAEFSYGSKSTNQMLELPKEVSIVNKSLRSNTAVIDLAESYNTMPADKKIMSLAAVVYTFTDLSFVDNAEVTVGGKPVSKSADVLFDRENIKLNPAIDPEKKNWQVVRLYFADETGKNLTAEERSIEVKQSLTLEYQIVDQLISGPAKSLHKALIPAETKIRDIKTEESICYVNLSNAFLSKQSADAQSNNMLVYSIVNSLTELDYVNKVQFLIEGEKVSGPVGDFDFSKPFDRNQELIK